LIWAGKDVANWIKGIESNQVQPNGVDLTISEIYKFKDRGFLLKDRRKLPDYEVLLGDIWELQPGSYIVRYKELIVIPENAVGIVLPRSSLMRMGVTLYTAVWDSGYEGRGISLLNVLNPYGIVLAKGSRISQIIFIEAKKWKKYEGIFKGEGLD